MDARRIAAVAVFTSTAVVFRVAKNLVTTVQFVNIPLAMAFVSSAILGYKEGFLVGFLSYVLSDMLIGPGFWTLVNPFLAGAFSAVFGFSYRRGLEKTYLFVSAFLSCFLFDVTTSVLFYMIFGLKPLDALVFGLLGLFVPVVGGFLVGVGPLTEFSTSALAVALLEALERRLGKNINIG
ncbi:ECF transporter S component [Thermofilum pendens]|uniref:ECF transporter S component n=1 Tax=Thermofilum pendens (strain DSM 2475 / Hrk 5) TaxID=368408 RepID=A1RW54_THEPD|nr:ECF transporter S component [Thermofilum pendens]ABL77434.1 hypothetical protein Tpen_0024 [Thermofilum pendens Hrk 5]